MTIHLTDEDLDLSILMALHAAHNTASNSEESCETTSADLALQIWSCGGEERVAAHCGKLQERGLIYCCQVVSGSSEKTYWRIAAQGRLLVIAAAEREVS